MNFFLTTYIFPIQHEIILSNKLNFKLDNPRTKDEINIIKENLKVSLDSPDKMYKHNKYMRIPINNIDENMLSIEKALQKFYKKYKDNNYIHDFYLLNNDCDILEQLAKMWIIARFSESKNQKLKEEHETIIKIGHKYLKMLDDNHPKIQNSDNLINFSYLLSVLINNEKDEYCGTGFILHSDINRLLEPMLDLHLNSTVMMFSIQAYRECSGNRQPEWETNFEYIKDIIINNSKKIEKLLSGDIKEKLLYISNLLKEASNTSDEKLKLMSYVSILELLLTHNPDEHKYNVENSIAKQFQTKIAILVYLHLDRKEDLKQLKNKLKIIYNQRSNIAHGNFKKYKNYVDSLSKKEGTEEYFTDLITDTIYFIRIILSEYIEDVDFVDFLKEN
ncbi:MAG: hypothetical protein DRG11_05200 [Epsilonproteobacteria bacterium]|nr:MAG: hypothetical protein DRG11_05200 [Campylobacterota bacterium]